MFFMIHSHRFILENNSNKNFECNTVDRKVFQKSHQIAKMEQIVEVTSVNSLRNSDFGSNGTISSIISREFGSPSTEVETLSKAEVWGWAFLFVSVINLSSVMGIMFFPLMKKSFYTLVMRVMIGLAIGSLTGSALFHLIPAAFDLGETNEKGQHYVHIAVFIWLSIWLVMLLECTIKIIVKTRARKKAKLAKRNEDFPLRQTENCVQSSPEIPNHNGSQLSIPNGNLNKVKSESSLQEEDQHLSTSHRSLRASHRELSVHHSTFSLNRSTVNALNDKDTDVDAIKTVAWLVIIGDSIHNFIDGVSIGAGFVKDFRTGAVISLAIVCEEFPHELGDFAILISSGFSVKSALLANFLSALTCYLGMALGILLGEIAWANYIFGFAAGIFLYVSLADMIPEITHLIEEVSEIFPQKSWAVLITHNIGILVGIAILYLLAIFQPK